MHEKEAYQVLAVGAKMEGIMESFTQEGSVINCKEKRAKKQKKKNLEGKFLAL